MHSPKQANNFFREFFGYLKGAFTQTPPTGNEIAAAPPPGFGDVVRLLRPHLRDYRWLGVLAALLALVSAALAVAVPFVQRYFIDVVLVPKAMDKLLIGLLLICGTMLMNTAVGFCLGYASSLFENRVALSFKRDLTERVIDLPKSFFDKFGVGYLMSRIDTDVSGTRWFYSRFMLSIVEQLLRLLGGVVMLFLMDWRIATVALVIVPCFFGLSHLFSRKQYNLRLSNSEKNAETSECLKESLENMTLIKAGVQEEAVNTAIAGHFTQMFKLNMQSVTLSGLFSLLSSGLPYLGRLIFLVLGSLWVLRGQWTIGELWAAMAYLGFVLMPARMLASSNISLQRARAAISRVQAIYSLLPETNLTTGKAVDRLRGEVSFEGVDFDYDEGKPVLKHVSFTIAPGETVGVVGASGEGKSTLAALIMRFYKQTSGTIAFDGTPADQFNLRQLRKRIGYVGQVPQLFTGTIASNVRFSAPHASDHDVLGVLKAVGALDVIDGLPDGLNSHLEENGKNLSVGQKLRLTVARELLRDPDVVIFDEPTSALDAHHEHILVEMLQTQLAEKTILLISHRLETVKHADRILFLNNGTIEAIGTFDELMTGSDGFKETMLGSEA